MTPNEYARDIVVPTVNEFIEEPLNARRMYLAFIVTYHLCDYLDPKKGGPERIQKKVEKLCSTDMLIVYEVCIGAKHAVPYRLNGFKAGDEIIKNPGFPYRFPVIFGETLCILYRGEYHQAYHCLAGTLRAFKKKFEKELSYLDLSKFA